MNAIKVKPDEKRLFDELLSRPDGFWAREVAAELGIPEKRAAYILSKWELRGWWEYGVNVLAGWFTDDGRSVVLESEETVAP